MGTHNGYVVGPQLFHTGDIAWSDLTSGWSAFTNWTTYTSTTIETKTGAKGSPLRYQTSIIDLGSNQYVYPNIRIGCTGTARCVIEYHASSSDLSSKSTIGAYTSDNTSSGTYDEVYEVLDYKTPGYTDDDYTGFQARYVRVTVYVENFASSTTRGTPSIDSLVIEFKNDMDREDHFDIATSGLTGSAEARVLVPRNLSTLTGIQVTAHSEANKKLVPHIVSKANKTIRVLDANTFDTAAVDATVDVTITGLPNVEVFEDGTIGRTE